MAVHASVPLIKWRRVSIRFQHTAATVQQFFPILGLLLAGACCAGQTPAVPSAAEANALLQSGKASEARAAFEVILSSDPADAQAQAGEVAASERLALDQAAAGNVVGALQVLLQAEKYVPRDARLEYDLGILEDQMHLYPEAQKSLAAAQQLHFDNPKLLYAQARVYMDQDQLAPAEEKMSAYLKLRPEDASAHYGLGRIYQLGIQFDKARSEFQESIRIHPEQTEAWYQLGDIALKQNQFDEALADFARTLARDPKHGGALAGSGEACYRQRHYDQALDLLERAISAAPGYQPGHYYLGLTLERLGRKEEADRELATAAKLADEDNKKSSTRYQLTVPPPTP